MASDQAQTTDLCGDDTISAHLKTALKRLERGEWRRAQINIEYARNRMLDVFGPLPDEENQQ